VPPNLASGAPTGSPLRGPPTHPTPTAARSGWTTPRDFSNLPSFGGGARRPNEPERAPPSSSSKGEARGLRRRSRVAGLFYPTSMTAIETLAIDVKNRKVGPDLGPPGCGQAKDRAVCAWDARRPAYAFRTCIRRRSEHSRTSQKKRQGPPWAHQTGGGVGHLDFLSTPARGPPLRRRSPGRDRQVPTVAARGRRWSSLNQKITHSRERPARRAASGRRGAPADAGTVYAGRPRRGLAPCSFVDPCPPSCETAPRCLKSAADRVDTDGGWNKPPVRRVAIRRFPIPRSHRMTITACLVVSLGAPPVDVPVDAAVEDRLSRDANCESRPR